MLYPETKQVRFTVTALSADDGEAAVTISTSTPDRGRDRVLPSGALLANYLKNPVVLFGHDYRALPVGTATSVEVSETGLTAKWRWLQGDEFASRVKNAWDQGMLRAASIGFNPVKWLYDEDRRGYDYVEWDLLEFSICPVPMNPEAVRTLSAAGITGDDLFEDVTRVAVVVDTAALDRSLDRLEAFARSAKAAAPPEAMPPMAEAFRVHLDDPLT